MIDINKQLFDVSFPTRPEDSKTNGNNSKTQLVIYMATNVKAQKSLYRKKNKNKQNFLYKVFHQVSFIMQMPIQCNGIAELIISFNL